MGRMKAYPNVEAYLREIPEYARQEYSRIRKLVKNKVPEAEETISYGMPTFKTRGTHLLYFGVFKDHMSVFPGASIVDELLPKLDGYKTAKGTIQFTQDKPLPDEIIELLLDMRLATIKNKKGS